MKARIVLCDDDGNIIPHAQSPTYDLELGGQTLNEIEQAVEQFRHKALPELEADLLKQAQNQQTQTLKKQDESSSMASSE